MGETIRIEREAGHRFVTDVVESFPGEIDSLSVSKPTLEDVFIHCTGHRFWTEEEQNNAANADKHGKKEEALRDSLATQTATISAPKISSATFGLTPVLSLWHREVVRFYRQKSRVVGIIASPVLFWVVTRLRVRHVVSESRRRDESALPGLLLSGLADHDRSVHGDFHHDVASSKTAMRDS